jgi:Putative protein-S-isoprenylcysteine methyltransferase
VTEASGRGPNVRIPPPFLFVAGFLIGWVIDTWAYHLWPALGPRTTNILDFVGGLITGCGVGLAILGMITFRRASTSIVPVRDASSLVRTGPYAFTRNPMYLGLSVAYVGGSFQIHSVWPIILLPFVIIALQRLVIEREERYLTATFGDAYRDYQREVRRWV